MDPGSGMGVAVKLAVRVLGRPVNAIDVRDALTDCLHVHLESFILRGMRYSDPLGTPEDVRRRVEDRARLFFGRLVKTFEQPSLPDLRRAQARMNRFLSTVRGSRRLVSGLHGFLIEQLFAAAAANDPVAAVDYVSRPLSVKHAGAAAVEVSFDPPPAAKPVEASKGPWLGDEPEYGTLGIDMPLTQAG